LAGEAGAGGGGAGHATEESGELAGGGERGVFLSDEAIDEVEFLVGCAAELGAFDGFRGQAAAERLPVTPRGPCSKCCTV